MVEQGYFKLVVKRYKALHILRLYYFAILFYALPTLSILLFILDQRTLNQTDMLFLIIFLVSLAPCALTGSIISFWGVLKGLRKKSKANIIIGVCLLILGVTGVVRGISGLALVYFMIS